MCTGTTQGRCRCDRNYAGEHCETHDPCLSLSCGSHGHCTSDAAKETAQCECEQGYHGATCEEFDPCRGVECGAHGVCQAEGARGACHCHAGTLHAVAKALVPALGTATM